MRGGLGSEYEVSLKTGATVLEYLPREKYQPRDILITKDGQWHMDGFGIEPARLRNSLDVVFNALHGEFGEDGQVQTLLDNTMLPYTGSGRLASALGMNKVAAKEIISRAGLKVPRGVHLKFKPETNAEAVAYDVFLKFHRLGLLSRLVAVPPSASFWQRPLMTWLLRFRNVSKSVKSSWWKNTSEGAKRPVVWWMIFADIKLTRSCRLKSRRRLAKSFLIMKPSIPVSQLRFALVSFQLEKKENWASWRRLFINCLVLSITHALTSSFRRVESIFWKSILCPV